MELFHCNHRIKGSNLSLSAVADLQSVLVIKWRVGIGAIFKSILTIKLRKLCENESWLIYKFKLIVHNKIACIDQSWSLIALLLIIGCWTVFYGLRKEAYKSIDNVSALQCD